LTFAAIAASRSSIGSLAERDAGLTHDHTLEMLNCISTALLHDLPCPPFPFAGVEASGTGNWTDADANERTLFLTRYVLPKPHHEPPA
jgi:hypothetical protein